MIPLHLTLRNFMSYGDEATAIDLRGMPVVCLSGDNGHGKSAILDAMTWALWGETRLGRQNHDQLVRLGADEMAVVLDFQEGDETYRVRRQRSRRVGAQIWELQIREDAVGWRSLSGQSSGDTGRAIVRVLRMNYETFLNSAFLRQGRADEFVRQTANKRKEILAEILDLSRYDDLEARARIKTKEAADRRLDAGRFIQAIEAEIAEEPALLADLPKVATVLLEARAAETKLSERAERLAEMRATLAAHHAQRQQAVELARSIEGQIGRYSAALVADRAAAEAAQAILADRERIEAEHSRAEKLQAKLPDAQAAAQRFRDLDRRRIQVEAEIDQKRRALLQQETHLVKQAAALTAEVGALPEMRRQLAALESSLAQLLELTQKRQCLWDSQSALASELAELRADYDACERDLSAARTRLESILAQKASCAICGSPLPPGKLALLADECRDSIKTLGEKLADLKRAGSAKRTEKLSTDDALAKVQAEITRLESARQQLGAAEHKVRDLAEIEQTLLPTISDEIDAVRGALRDGRYAEEACAALMRIEPELAALKDSERLCEQMTAELQTLRWTAAARAHLQTAQREFDAAAARMRGAEQALTDLAEQQSAAAASLARSADLDGKLSENAREFDEVRRLSVDAREAVQRSEREETRLQDKLAHIAQSRNLLIQRQAELLAARNDEDLYSELAGAFGKRGVQALIIENALPELENDANELLERITDGELSITIQTTRQAKSRGVGDAPIETLDIAIRDHLGTRPLEMYSGGESFRVSFALRIALSKLLTRRAGAHHQTLIVDEGFGTQDAKGREKLVDAIMAIQSEFAQIIVITHVDELKDAFPNRIEVVKTATGSELTLVGGAALG